MWEVCVSSSGSRNSIMNTLKTVAFHLYKWKTELTALQQQAKGGTFRNQRFLQPGPLCSTMFFSSLRLSKQRLKDLPGFMMFF